MKHKHHIIPKYEGGSDDPTNLVEISVIEHTMWHFAEWQRKQNMEDFVAWKMLSGQCGNEEVIRARLSLAGKVGGTAITRDEAYRNKMSQANKGKKRTKNQKRAMSERLMGHTRHTAESKAKSSRANKGQRRSAETRERMRSASRDTTNIGAHLKNLPSQVRQQNARKGVLKNHGWNGFYSANAEFRTALSETFVEYASKFGIPRMAE